MKRFLVCSKCELESKTTVFKWVGQGYGVEVRRLPFILGEINNEGNVVVKRAQHGYTVVGGNNFTVYCNRCGDAVYKKETIMGTSNLAYIFKEGKTDYNTPTGTVGLF